MKRTVKKILSAVLASAMVFASVSAVSYAAKPTEWSVGVENKDEAIQRYTVTAARNAEFEVPVKVYNNSNLNNYTFYVNYNPSELMLIDAVQGDFSMSSADLMAKSVNHIPAVGNPSFPTADGSTTEAGLGRVKFAYSADVAGTTPVEAEEITLFTLKFRVVEQTIAVGDQYWIRFDTDAAALYADNAADITVEGSDMSAEVSNGYVLIIGQDNPGGSGGGGGGGSVVRPTTTTEATTEAATSDTPSDEPGDTVTLNDEDHFAYVVGYPDGSVQPNGQITRAEVASIYFRLLSESDRANFYTNANSFSDVDVNFWYNIAVSTMTDADIVHGYPDGTFLGNAPITRAEFATIAAQFDNHYYSGTDRFSDIEGHWANSFINAAADLGWISGYEDGTFKPNQYITRAEAMTLINNMLNRHVSVDGLLDDMNTWFDNMNEDAWYYTIVQEATNSHYYNRPDGAIEDWTEMREAPDWASIERPGSTYQVLVPEDIYTDADVDVEVASEEATEETTEVVEETTEAVTEE